MRARAADMEGAEASPQVEGPASAAPNDKDAQFTRWLERLSAPEHEAHFRTALEALGNKVVVMFYKSYFIPGREARSFRVVKVPLHKVTAGAVLDGLGRLRQHEAEAYRKIARLYLTSHEGLLEQVQQATLPDDVSPATLQSLHWLLETELTPAQTAQSLTAALDTVQALRRSLAEERERRLAAERAVQQGLATTARLEQRLEGQQAEAQGRLDDAHRQHRHQQEVLKTRWERQLEREQERHDRTRSELRAQVLALEESRDRLLDEQQDEVFDQVREVRATLHRERIDWDLRRVILHRQLASQHSEVTTLRQAMADLQAARPALPNDAELHGALLMDYEALGERPDHRLLGLFRAYRAFLEGRQDPLLDRATNLRELQGRELSGVVLLGLERLLEDGANLPLDRFLTSRIFQQEAHLHDLVAHVDSPRLDVTP